MCICPYLIIIIISTWLVGYFKVTSDAECGDPPELQNGRISHLNETFVLYDCIDGYQFQEGIGYGTSRTCLTNGIWTNENIFCSE